MKKYVSPEIEITLIENIDIIATSFGIETLPLEDDDVIWEING